MRWERVFFRLGGRPVQAFSAAQRPYPRSQEAPWQGLRRRWAARRSTRGPRATANERCTRRHVWPLHVRSGRRQVRRPSPRNMSSASSCITLASTLVAQTSGQDPRTAGSSCRPRDHACTLHVACQPLGERQLTMLSSSSSACVIFTSIVCARKRPIHGCSPLSRA